MPATYGPELIVTARSLVQSSLVALQANMVANSITPGIASIITIPNPCGAYSYNAVAIGIEAFVVGVEQTTGANKTEQVHFSVVLRVLTAPFGGVYDDETVGKLLQSIANWFQERRHLSDSGGLQWMVIGRIEASLDDTFEDIAAIGGTLRFVITVWRIYTAVVP